MAGLDRVLSKLQQSVEGGNYYEAHQMYNSLAQRYIKQGKYKEVLGLLQSGALNLLKHQQYGSATDLCRRILEVYEAAGTEVNDASIGPLVELFDSFDLQSSFAIEFVRDALRWSSKNGAHATGDPYLQHVFGMRYFKAKDYYQAESHFAVGTIDSAKALGWMAFQWSEEGYPADKGYFIARGVMLYLARRRIACAETALSTFLHAIEVDPDTKLPLAPISFASSSRNAPDLFLDLRNQYRNLIDQDRFLSVLMDRIGLVFFRIGQQAPNVLQGLMSSLFGGAGAPGAGQQSPAAALLD
ncbi:hypothetical protein DFJ74DRAFT_705812 [Hyaloraphidium curvatum]|nr:hypothetical protein DFJ74DRAFT_705812 [Hyaloraphidium curvatum]